MAEQSFAGLADQIRVLVCTANLGNAQPDHESLAAWIPRDGLCKEVIKPNPTYPLRMNMEGIDDHTFDLTNPLLEESDKHLTGPEDLEASIELPTTVAVDPTPSDASSPSPSGVRVSSERMVTMARSLAVWARNLNKKVAAAEQTKQDVDNDDDEKEDDDDHGGPRPDQLVVDDMDQFDIIVIGMQEATFDPPATPSRHNNDNKSSNDLTDTERTGDDHVKIHLPAVEPIQKGAKRVGKNVNKGVQKIARLTQNRDYTKQGSGHLALPRRDWGGGAAVLHAMFDAQLPSYDRVVSYQRGQMRLEVYSNSNDVEVEVLHVTAHNTGLAGLANKGGIVTELLVNGSTRISFLTAHLEAHEGHSKYLTRCSSLGDILSGTKNSKWHDVSLTSHFTFVMGDLNFRTELDATLPKDVHKRAIQAMVAKENWYGLNRVDELHRALRQKTCLVGYHTPICNFPPTFKTVVQRGFNWQEKRRPSYCDRVLWKSETDLETGLSPLVYEPIPDFATSDHKPVRAAFSIDMNRPFRLRPRVMRGRAANRFKKSSLRNSLAPSNKSVTAPSERQAMEKVELFLSNIAVDIFDKEGIAPNPYVALISYPEAALKTNKKWRLLPVCCGKQRKGKRRARGWPATSRKFGTFSPSWVDEEEIGCKIKMHAADGTPIDLTGALLCFTVLDYNPAMVDDSHIGTHRLNLVPVLTECRELANEIEQRQNELNASIPSQEGRFRAVQKSMARWALGKKSAEAESITTSMSLEDPISSMDIDSPLLKNGREVGRITCKLEAWWINSTTAKILASPIRSVRSSTTADGKILSKMPSGARRSKYAMRRSNLVSVQEE